MPFSNCRRAKYKQVKPYNLPLPYSMYDYYGKHTSEELYSDGTVGPHTTVKEATLSSNSFTDFDRRDTACANKAYERFKASVGDNAGWAENIAQAGKAVEMFTRQAQLLGKVVTDLRKGSFAFLPELLHYGEERIKGRTVRDSRFQKYHDQKAYWTLKHARNESKRKTWYTDVAGMFLEFEYGLRPLVKDLVDTHKVLTSDPGIRKVHGSCRDTIRERSFTRSRLANGSYATTDTDNYCSFRWKLGGFVRVSNPNLYLANALGVVDIALPWKLIPFSFVADWFFNLEQVISSHSDWFGLTFYNPWRSHLRYGKGTTNSHSYTVYSSTLSIITNDHLDREFVEMDRVLGLSQPTFQLKPFRGFSLERGAQAIALITSVFAGQKVNFH